MALMIDAPAIAGLIQKMVDLSMDGRVAKADQEAYLAAAVALQKGMLPTLYATFSAGTAEVADLNGDLAAANEAIGTATTSLEATRKVFKIVGEILGDLAAVVKLAAKVAVVV